MQLATDTMANKALAQWSSEAPGEGQQNLQYVITANKSHQLFELVRSIHKSNLVLLQSF